MVYRKENISPPPEMSKMDSSPIIAPSTADTPAAAGSSGDYVAFLKLVMDYEISGDAERVDGTMHALKCEIANEARMAEVMGHDPETAIRTLITKYNPVLALNDASMAEQMASVINLMRGNREKTTAMAPMSAEEFSQMQAIRAGIEHIRLLMLRFRTMVGTVPE